MKSRKKLLSTWGIIFTLTASLFVSGQTKSTKDIETMRAEIQKNGYSYSIKDYGKDFFIPGRNSKNLSRMRSQVPAVEMEILTDLPSSFDSRDVDGKAYIGEIRDQGSLGSCYAFGACAAAEGCYNKTTNLYDDNCIDFSESYIAWSLGSISPYSDHFSGGNGADFDYYELQALTSPGENTGKEGICLESDFPYQESQPSTTRIEESWNHPRTLFSSWGRVYPENYEDTTQAIKTAIYTYGVVDAAVLVAGNFDSYSSGVYEDTNTTPSASPYYNETTNHAISLVGWDDNPAEGGGGCWILRNSWGSTWGESGYMRIRYKSAAVNCAACYLTLKNITTGSISIVSSSSVNLTGSILPLNNTVNGYFEYGTTDAYGMQTPAQNYSGSTTEMSHTITGLSLNTEYHYRAVYSYNSTLSYGEDKTFMLSTINVATGSQSGITNTEALVAGSISNPGKNTFDYYVEYRKNGESYQKTETLSSSEASVSPSIKLQNLDKNSLYYYRIVGSNFLKTVYGAPRFFKTTNDEIILYQDFEESTWTGWSQTQITGTNSWTQVSTDIKGNTPPSNAFMVMLSEDSYDENVTRLISPSFDATSGNPLIFHHLQADYWGDHDSLKVYYRTSSSGTWTLIPEAEYSNAVDTWIERSLSLPNPTNTYQVAFEGSTNYGYGCCIDLVKNLGATSTFSTDWALFQ